jgi:hypothetical protein
LLPLKPGAYQYRFIVDGHWMEDPNNPNTVESPYGVKNSMIDYGTQEENR